MGPTVVSDIVSVYETTCVALEATRGVCRQDLRLYSVAIRNKWQWPWLTLNHLGLIRLIQTNEFLREPEIKFRQFDLFYLAILTITGAHKTATLAS